MLVSGPYGPKEKSGIWVIPARGGQVRKLLDDASAGAVLSPDDTRVAFRRGQGIWLADVAGGQPRRLFAAPPGYSPTQEVSWSPDGHRIAFGKRRHADGEFSIEVYDLATGRTHSVLSDPRIEFLCWPPDGRMIYSRREDPPNDNDSNLWDIRIDARTAQAVGRPRRLTNWGGFLLSFLAVSRDGQRLFSIGNRWRSDVLVADLTGAPSAARRLTSEWLNRPTGWTSDSRTVLFDSDRNGVRGLFQQGLDMRETQPLVARPDDARGSRLSPDGRWLLYLSWPQDGEGRLMRVPARGGTPEAVFRVTGFAIARKSGYPAIEPRHPRFRCPSVPQAPCILSEQVEDQVVFTTFDPVEGRKGKLTAPDLKAADQWDLSPDGKWIAVAGQGRIRLVSLAGQAPREIPTDSWLEAIAWAADGKSLFAVPFVSQGEPLLRISLAGNAQLLYRGTKYLNSPVPSPDGRYVVFADMTVESNVWVIENLR